MNVTRVAEAPMYVAPGHHGVCTSRLQGLEAGHTDRFWVGVSLYHPGGFVEMAPTREETIYVVLAGELVVTTEEAETVLRRLDSIRLTKGEVRSVINRSDNVALLMVTVAHASAEES